MERHPSHNIVIFNVVNNIYNAVYIIFNGVIIKFNTVNIIINVNGVNNTAALKIIMMMTSTLKIIK